MPESESTTVAMSPPQGTSGWDAWAPELLEPPAPLPPMQWLAAVSVALWACTTLLALQYL